MTHDFTLVYELRPDMATQDEILCRLAGGDCADATVGLGRPGHVALAFCREAIDRETAVALATAQGTQALPGAVLVRLDTA